MEITIYNLKLHESIFVKSDDGHPTVWRITRVPGGWLYVDDNDRRTTVLAFFVPFNNDFEPA